MSELPQNSLDSKIKKDDRDISADTRIVESVLEKLAEGKTYDEIITTNALELNKKAVVNALEHAVKILKKKERSQNKFILKLKELGWIDDEVSKEITLWGHISLTALLLIITILSAFGMWIFADSRQKAWINFSTVEPIKWSELSKSNTNSFVVPTDGQRHRLDRQLQTINELVSQHGQIMSFFYQQYYISLSIGSGGAFIALFCILFISKEGWKSTNNAIINVGTTSFAIGLFFLTISKVFQHEDNLKTSQNLYANDLHLRNSFLTRVHTNRGSIDAAVKKNDLLDIYDLLIRDTDAKLKDLSLIRLGFDPTPIFGMNNKIGGIMGVETMPVTPTPTPKSTP
jgi:hypothetical protein